MTVPSTLSGESAVLARELADFLIELSITLHKHAIYPAGHPLLDGAVVGLERRLAGLVAERGGLSFGVARHQLVIEGVATDAAHPVLRELAGRFHRHHLGAVRFTALPSRATLVDLLRTLATDGARTGAPLGLAGPEALARWPGVALFPLTFARLELLEDDSQPAGEVATRGAQLWVGLARAALAGDTALGDAPISGEPPSTDPVVVARAIEAHARDVAYDQVVVGYLLHIAEELRKAPEQEAAPLRRRISNLVSSLHPDTLRHLLAMGGDAAQRQRFVLDAVEGLAADAVVELVQAAASASEQTISHSMLRLLAKFAVHAEVGTERVRPDAEGALRDHVRKLVVGWRLDDPNPEGYRAALEAMSRAMPRDETVETTYPCEPERLVSMALEVGVVGGTVWRAVDALTAERLAALLDLLERTPTGESQAAAAEAIWAHAVTLDRLRAVLEGSPVDVALAGRLARRLGAPAAAGPLLDALSAADERHARALVDLLATLGPAVGEACAARLAQRGRAEARPLLAVMGRLAELPGWFSAMQYATHGDPEVRREAFKILLRRPATREVAICTALADADERLVRSGMSAALGGCPDRAVPLLQRRAADPSLSPEARALGVRVLGTFKDARVRDWLVDRARVRRRFTGRTRLAPKSPELLATLAALANGWRNDPVVAPVLALARRSSDVEVRLATALRTGGAGVPTPAISSRRTATAEGD